ncbi:hypothetical protein FRB90_002981 [Tulasnella sp. 427]|nr:hypothetical protein FRB90_002981 [Tulasnella sp. 427]
MQVLGMKDLARFLTVDLGDTALQEEVGRLLDRLGDGKCGSRGDTLEEIICFPGTRTSILNTIDDWLKDQSVEERVMWIGGMAGRGKSTIASTVVHNWKARGSCAIFHFRRGQTVLNARVVCSLVRQLGNSMNPAIRKAVVDTVRQNRDIADKCLEEQFGTLLVGSLSKLHDHSHPVLFVLDALDESDDGKEASKLVQFIDQFSSSLSPNVKFLLTCRIEGYIPRKLESRGWRKINLDLVVDVSSDIETLIRQKCKEIREEHHLPESWPHFEELALLATMSEGLFQWLDRLRMLLKYPERWSGLDDVYHQILEKAFHNVEFDLDRQRLLHSLLGTLVVAPVPVHLDSLAGLFGSEEYLKAEEPSAIIHFLRNDFLSDLTSLIFIPASVDEPLQLMHASIGDLLTNKTRCKERPYHINSDQLHLHLAGVCLRQMVSSLEHTWSLSNSWEAKWKVSSNVEQKAHRYPCLAWSTHLTKGVRVLSSGPVQIPTSITIDFEAFSRQKVLLWLEHMSLFGAISDAVRMAREVHRWLLGLEAYEELKKHILLWHDTQRFVSMFTEPIMYSPQHIYTSALPSCPTGTGLGKYYARHATVKTILGAKETWSSGLWTRSVGAVVLGTRFAPDGQRIAVLNWEGLHFREPSAGDMIGRRCDIPARGSQSMVLSSDLRVLAMGFDNGTIQLWDTLIGNRIGQPLEGHSSWITSVSFSPDDTVLASSSHDHTIRLWDARTGNSIGQPLEGHSSWITSVSFSPDGTVLASSSHDHTIRLWDSRTGNSIGQPLEGHSDWINSISFSPDGTVLASGSNDKTIRLWDTRTENSIGQPLQGHSGSITSLSFSSDGTVLASGSSDQTIRLWDTRTGNSIGQPLEGHSDWITSLSFSPDGTVLASGSYDNTIRLWDARTGNSIGQPLQGHSRWITSVSFSPDGTVLASGLYDQTIRLWDTRTGNSIGQPFEGHSDWISSISFSPDGTVLASGSNDKTIRLWNAHTGNSIGQPLEGHFDRVTSISFSPDGTVLASGSWDETIGLWDSRTGISIGQPLEGHSGSITSVLFSPDGTVLAVGSCDNTIRLWDARTGNSIGQPLEGHSGSIRSILFSPDGTVLASGSWDETIRLWDARTGNSIGQPLECEPGWVISTLFLYEDTPFTVLHADGRLLALRETEIPSKARLAKSPDPSLPVQNARTDGSSDRLLYHPLLLDTKGFVYLIQSTGLLAITSGVKLCILDISQIYPAGMSD